MAKQISKIILFLSLLLPVLVTKTYALVPQSDDQRVEQELEDIAELEAIIRNIQTFQALSQSKKDKYIELYQELQACIYKQSRWSFWTRFILFDENQDAYVNPKIEKKSLKNCQDEAADLADFILEYLIPAEH